MLSEHKAFAFKLDAPPDDQGRFSGYAAVFGNVDRGNDVIEPGATTKTIQENPDVPLFWVHNYGLVPIGTGKLSNDAQGKGVRINGDLFLDTPELAREVFGAMKAGAVRGLSIGYNTLKRTYKGPVRQLQEIAIGEVSLCPFPMNPLAEVDGLKAAAQFLRKSGEDVDALMAAISSGSDFMRTLVQADKLDLAQSVQSIIQALAGSLFNNEDGQPDEADALAAMQAPASLLATKQVAVTSEAEDALAVRDLIASMKV